MKMTAILIAAALVFAVAGEGQADFVLFDDAHIDITTTHTRGIQWDSSTVDVKASGRISAAYVHDEAQLDITGGIADWLYTYNSSVAVVSGGVVTQSAYAYDTSAINISGGTVTNWLDATDSSSLTISDGSVLRLRAYDTSTVEISGGQIDDYLASYNSSSVTISEGQIKQLTAYGASTVTVTGGNISHVALLDDDSAITISGGDIHSIFARGTSSLTLVGTGFRATGGLTLDGETVLGTGLLVGKWYDDTSWIIPIGEHDTTATIRVISEPAVLTWDGTDPAEWASAHWNPGPIAPIPDTPMVVDSGTVTISSDLTGLPAASLAIASGTPGGTVSIASPGTLVVTDSVTISEGGTANVSGMLRALTVTAEEGGRLNIDGEVDSPNVTVSGGVLTGAPAPRKGMIWGSLELTDGATYAVDVTGAGVDRLGCSGMVIIDPSASLEIVPVGGGNEFQAGTYTLVEAAGGLSGTFTNVTDLNAYVSVNGNGLTHDEAAGTVTLTLDMNLNPGDANLNGATDVLDRIIWNNHNFTEGTTFVTGDWNNDGATDVSDRIIWNSHHFTVATPGPLGTTAVTIPEPATLSLLAFGGLAMLRRRRRINSSNHERA